MIAGWARGRNLLVQTELPDLAGFPVRVFRSCFARLSPRPSSHAKPCPFPTTISPAAKVRNSPNPRAVCDHNLSVFPLYVRTEGRPALLPDKKSGDHPDGAAHRIKNRLQGTYADTHLKQVILVDRVGSWSGSPNKASHGRKNLDTDV